MSGEAKQARARVNQLRKWLREDVGKGTVSASALADCLDAVIALDRAERALDAKAIVEIVAKNSAKFVAELTTRIDRVDGAHLLKGSVGQLLAANLAALDRLADDVELRKSTITTGTASPFVRRVIAG